MDNLVISSSLLKTLFHHNTLREDVCMKKVKANFFDGIRSPASEVQEYGLYFESLALGATARDVPLLELPRSATGKKTATHQRLDDQHEQLKLGMVEHFIQIVPGVNTQIEVFKRWNETTLLRATLDIFPTPILFNDRILPIAAIDLKTTKDLDSDYGEYGWARPESMDHTQLILQNYIFREFDVKLNQEKNPSIFEKGLIRKERMEALNDLPVFYWVFEYGTKMRNTIIKVNIDTTKLSELKEVIRKTEVLVWELNRDGWEATPKFNNCKNCPLNYLNGGLCKQAKIIREV